MMRKYYEPFRIRDGEGTEKCPIIRVGNMGGKYWIRKINMT